MRVVFSVATKPVNLRSLSCCDVYVSFVTLHFGCKELDILLKDILDQTGPKPESTQSELDFEAKKSLENILRSSVFGAENSAKWELVPALTDLQNLLPLLDHIDGDQKRKLAKEILAKIGDEPISEPLTVNSVLLLCSALSDSVDALTIADETRQISVIICSVIGVVDYGHDFENQLKFYTECRGKFRILDLVQIHLVHRVLNVGFERFE